MIRLWDDVLQLFIRKEEVEIEVENMEQEEKILRRELYRVKCPAQIVAGDPLYFEEFKGMELNRLVVKCTPPSYFDARVSLTEVELPQLPGEKLCSITIYLAHRRIIDTYVNGMMYEG